MSFVPACLGLASLLSEMALARWKRADRASSKGEYDKGSLWMLWRVITVSITLGVLLASFRISPTLPGRVPCALVGVALFGIGTVLRWWSIQHRGRFFTVDVAIASDHRLVDTGPYRWVRHPSYTGLLLQFAGLALSLNNLLSAIAVIGPITLALNHSIRIEEEALRNTLGEA